MQPRSTYHFLLTQQQRRPRAVVTRVRGWVSQFSVSQLGQQIKNQPVTKSRRSKKRVNGRARSACTRVKSIIVFFYVFLMFQTYFPNAD